MFAPGVGRFLVPSLAATAAFALLAAVGPAAPWAVLALVALGLCAFFAVFFRDPERAVGDGIVSAADGRVLSVLPEADRVRIAVFMNVTNVHVNRVPLDGEVSGLEHRGAGSRPAYAPEASHNRRCHYTFSSAIGPVEVVQMTGLVARRLVPLVRVGDRCRRGDRFGMILLGSRVDVVLPLDRVEVTVAPGDRVTAGVTTIARVRA